MKHGRLNLRDLFRLNNHASQRAAEPVARRSVVMRVTLDAQHATPLRQALIRDCAGQPWTIRQTPLAGTRRVRLVLYLPRTALQGAIQSVTHLAPGAQIEQMMDVPAAPTDAWTRLIHHTPAHADSHERREEVAFNQDAIARYLTEDHVLLDLPVPNRASLFAKLGEFLEAHYGLPAQAVVAGLTAREALGSTALGQGVAVPHGQIKGLSGALALYVRPLKPIAFDAPDCKPVTDLVALFVPEWANTMHLQLLADVAQRFCDQHFREQLRDCRDPHAVYRLFADFESRDAAERSVTH
jgi:nitrogen PTS system EIIA component